jgi:hypothetical protein
MKSRFYEISFSKVSCATSLILVLNLHYNFNLDSSADLRTVLPCRFVGVSSALKLQCSLFWTSALRSCLISGGTSCNALANRASHALSLAGL